MGFAVSSGVASAGERVLSTVGSWRVILNLNPDNSFNRCLIETTQGGQMLRIAGGAKSTDLSLSVPAMGIPNGGQGTIGSDGMQPEYFTFAANKLLAWTAIPWEMGLHLEKARSIEVGVNRRQMKWRVSGTKQAMIRMTDCVNQNAP